MKSGLVGTGSMQWQIEIQELSNVTGGSGMKKPSFTTIHNVWAKKEEVGRVGSGSDEDFEDGLLLATSTAIFTIDFINGLDTSMRVISDGNQYDILGIEEVGFRRQARIKAKHRSND